MNLRFEILTKMEARKKSGEEGELESKDPEIIPGSFSYSSIRLDDYLKLTGYPEGWEEFFERRDIQKELSLISDQLYADKDLVVYPEIDLVLKIFWLCRPTEVRVILTGQDPYPNGSATGLCFEVKPGNKLNPSFRNIMKELEDEGFQCGGESRRDTGCLRHWLNQGVFLYNMALTVIEGTPKSHSKIWEKFSHEVIKYVSRINKNLVFILLGKDAQAIVPSISCYSTHCVLTTSHPSPMAASSGFFGSDIFNRCNKFLLKVSDEPIDFSIKDWGEM